MMTEHTPSEKKFDDYMEGKSKLSALYQDSETSGPGEFIDHSILKAARDEVKKDSLVTQKHRRWHIPVSIAAAFITAIIIIQVVPQKEQNIAELNGSKSTNDESIVTAGKAAPERLLDKISAHIESNDLEKAREEYRLFLKLFPDYKIDYKKHPNLKKIEP